MKYKSKNMKKGVSMALTAMMVVPTTTAAYASPINETTKEKKVENVPYNVLNQKVLSNPASTATPAVNPSEVYTSFTGGNDNNSGNGSIDNPYNRFEDAVAKVDDGGTIYIKTDGQGGFLNDVGENKPFLIDKNITIKAIEGEGNAELSVRSAGIILGADVKFENITLNFTNKHHDAIFANGHTLELINVSRYGGAREIDLFAGGLYELNGTQVHPSGTNGVITIETNENFGGGDLESDFGNIYAGSMNGSFNGDAEINLSRKDNSKKLKVRGIKASGALEADAGNMLDTTEPLPPFASPEAYPMSGNVEINLDNYQVDVDGKTGTEAKTNVTTSTKYPTTLSLKDVEHLTIEEGHVTATYESDEIPTVTLGDGATLDLSEVEKEITLNNLNGNGIVMLHKDGILNITNAVDGDIELQTKGAFNGKSGLVTQDHVYITTPNADANITFNPHATQSYLELVGNEVDGLVEWTVVEAEGATKLVEINDLTIEDANATQVKAYDGSNDVVKFPFNASVNADPEDLSVVVDLNQYPLEITVNGKEATYREDADGYVQYFVEDLELAMYFASETNFDEHELVVMGQTEDFNATPIKVGEYEIEVSHIKEDGTSVGFTSNLTVTGDDVEGDDTPEVDPPTDEDGWLKTTNMNQVEFLWNYTIDEDTQTVVLNSFKGFKGEVDEIKLEIPRTVNGYKVALADLNNDVFNGVNQIRVAEGTELVKVLATDIHEGFKENNDLKYVDLEGLDVSEVTNMSELFSMCPNLRVIELLGWDIKDATNVRGMFYAKTSATDEEKKILVITDSDKFNSYFFGYEDGRTGGDNRLPSMFTFNANEGYFFEVDGDKVVNMIVPNYTIDTDSLEELDGLFDYYLSHINDPIREGYEFKGWFTEDAEPTNVYELLNMTYKAEWEEVVEDENPEEQPPTGEGNEGNEGDGGNGEDDSTPDTEQPENPDTPDNPTEPQPPTEGGEGDNEGDNEGEGDAEDTPTQPQPPTDNEGEDNEGDNEGGDDEEELPSNPDQPDNGEGDDSVVETFFNKVKEVVMNTTDNIETKIQKFKDLLTNEGENNVDDTSDEVYENVIDEIKNDIDAGTNKYTTLDAIKELIKSIVSGDEEQPEGGDDTVTPDQPENPDTPEQDKPEQDGENNGNGGSEGDSTPPTEGDGDEGNDNTQQPNPPSNGGGTQQPPSNDEVEKPQPKPPVSGGGGGGGSVQPPSDEETDKEEEKPSTPSNGIENLKDLDKELQEKVDSIIAESVIEKQSLVLNITGDKDDIGNINHIEVTKEGIFAVVDGKKLKFGTAIDGLDLDLNNARVIRINVASRGMIKNYSAVAHKNIDGGLKISSNDLENILITSKVNEPFADVNDTDWFKSDVEEAYNYGFTMGTSATTYNPDASITRGEFAVMIARALELQSSDKAVKLKDIGDKWYQNEVQALYELGIIKGNADGTFGGDNKITRQEAAAIITRMLEYMNVDVAVGNTVEFNDTDNISAFAKDSVQYLASQGVLVGGGDNKFNPTNNLTRAEMAKILVRSLKLSNWY